MDHWVATDDLVQGYNGEKYGLTFYDRATGWIQSEGVQDKTAESVRWFLTLSLIHISEPTRLDVI
eukprot:4214356-Prorocentrum_lima.AAC.1